MAVQLMLSYLQVLSDPCSMYSFGNYRRTPLNTPTQEHLRAARHMCLRDRRDIRVIRELALSNRRIGCQEDLALAAESEQFVLRKRWMELHLIHCRDYVRPVQQFGQCFHTEVRDPDSPSNT